MNSGAHLIGASSRALPPEIAKSAGLVVSGAEERGKKRRRHPVRRGVRARQNLSAPRPEARRARAARHEGKSFAASKSTRKKCRKDGTPHPQGHRPAHPVERVALRGRSRHARRSLMYRYSPPYLQYQGPNNELYPTAQPEWVTELSSAQQAVLGVAGNGRPELDNNGQLIEPT